MTFQQAFCGVLLPFHTNVSIIILTVFILLLQRLHIALVDDHWSMTSLIKAYTYTYTDTHI